MHNRHGWTDRTPEGVKREVIATKFGGRWSFEYQLRGEEGWTPLDPPALEDLQRLREILERKYQRRRAAIEDVHAVEKLIREREAG